LQNIKQENTIRTMRKKYNLILAIIFMLGVHTVYAQSKVITGTVKDAGNGDPLPGVNVTVKGTNIGASTDFDGKYKIKADKGQTLVFSFIGYETASKKVGDSNVINVSMKEEQEMLKAVTINALGIEVKKASQKAIAISNVKAKTLLTSGENDPVAALSGKVSGVNINLASGDPGASTNITIRGPKSILLSNKPLFVVDGVPVVDDIYGSGVAGVERPSKIADIDPNNIESIKILKGGSAAAIWGSKGANGVVLITTKRGKGAKKGQINVTVTSSFGMDQPLTKFPLQDKYGQGTNGKYPDPGQSFDKSGSWGDKISERSGQPDLVDTQYFYFLDQDNKKWGFIYQKNSKETFNKKNYDAVIGIGNTLRNSVQLSTATEKAKYFLGFNHLNQDGIFAQSYFKKLGVSFNTIIKPTKKLNIKTNLQYTNTKQNAIQKGSNLSGLLLGLYRTPADFDNSGYFGQRFENGVFIPFSHRSYRQPVGTVYKGRGYKGESAGYNNPLFTVYKQKNPYYSNHIIAGTNFIHQTKEWLKLIAKIGIDYANESADEYFPVNSADAVTGSYSTYLYTYMQLSGDLIGQINKEIAKDINMDVLIGVNWFHRESDYTSAYYYDFLLPTATPTSSNAVNEKKYPGLGSSVKRKNSAYGSATFSYKDLLYTTLTGRAERSSGYYGLISYPSASLAFDVHNLDYFKDKEDYFLNKLTLRASWSKVGNEPGSYLLDTYFRAASGSGYDSYWSAADYGGAFWRSIIKGNPDLKPEITTEWEVGADIKMFKNRLTLNLSYYDSKSEDLLLYEKVPAATGFLYRWNNVAAMTNKGYEVEARYRIIDKTNLNWSIGGTYTHNKNIVTKLEGSEYIGLNGFISTSSGVAEDYGYGILRSGDFKRDANGKLELNDNGFPKAGDKIFAGDPNADFKASLYTDFNYKNFKFRVLADGSFGGQTWDGTYGALTFFGRTLETANEVTVDGSIVNSQGTPVSSLVFGGHIAGVDNGDGTYTVRGNVQDFGAGEVLLDETWYTGVGGGFGPVGTQFFRDATWIKLREVSAGYTFRGKLLDKTKIKSIYFGITGRNLYLWTKDKNWHIDPESNLSGSSRGRGLQYFNHPTTKSVIFTTTINF